MLNLIIGIAIGFFCGTITGIVMMCIMTAGKEQDEMVKKYESERKDE